LEAYLALATALLVVLLGLWMLWTQRYLLPLPGRESDPAHRHDHDHDHDHRQGWGPRHSHRLDLVANGAPSWGLLLGLGAAGGLLPDPAALAILLAAVASGKLVIGLLTVVVFSVGFATVLVAVGAVAARVGQAIITWLSGRWVEYVQLGTATVIAVVGLVLTYGAWQSLSRWSRAVQYAAGM
jgi:nickel/cobalt exporter